MSRSLWSRVQRELGQEDTFATLRADIENGFDLVHIDYCHFRGSYKERLKASAEAIHFCQDLNPRIKIEVGTDENVGAKFSTAILQEIREEVAFFKAFCDPVFHVVQTGSLVREAHQAGSFNRDFSLEAAEILHKAGVLLKEHNADYLDRDGVDARVGVVDAMNIAPQLGVVQSSVVLSKCHSYGVDYTDLLETVFAERKWKKWMNGSTPAPHLCFLISAHYHFANPAYQRVLERLAKHEDIQESIVDSITEVIAHYENG